MTCVCCALALALLFVYCGVGLSGCCLCGSALACCCSRSSNAGGFHAAERGRMCLMRCPVVHHVVACSSYVQAVWDCLRGLWASSEKRGAPPVGQARIQHIVYCCLAIWCCVLFRAWWTWTGQQPAADFCTCGGIFRNDRSGSLCACQVRLHLMACRLRHCLLLYLCLYIHCFFTPGRRL